MGEEGGKLRDEGREEERIDQAEEQVERRDGGLKQSGDEVGAERVEGCGSCDKFESVKGEGEGKGGL